MPDVKVSTRQELAFNEIDHEADLMLVTDTSAVASRAMKASELMRAAAPYLSTAWDFATGSVGPTVSFTRASSGYRYNSAGLLVSETTDVPRFQYDPVALTPRGLLIEESSVGMLTKTEKFDHADWSKQRASVVADTGVAPDDATSMDFLVEDSTAANTHNVSQIKSFTAGLNYVFSAFVKASTRSWIFLELISTAFGASRRVWFNVGTGTVGTIPAGWTAYIHSIGDGVYRLCVIAPCTTTASGAVSVNLATADNSPTYSGDGASGLYVWGANLTQADCVTSYVPADAVTVTRAGDVALITNRRVLTDQCWVVKGRTPRRIANGAVNIAFEVDDGTNSNRRCLQYRTDGTLAFIATAGGATQCLISLGAVAADTDFTASVRWATNNFAASLNGAAIVTDVSGTNPEGMTTARVGCGAGGNFWNSTIQYIETRRTATDAELVLLSR